MPGPIAEAFVQIHPDVGAFPAELRASVDRAFSSVEASSDRAGRDISDSFSDAASGSGKHLLSIAETASRVGTSIDNSFRSASTGMRENLGDVSITADRVGAAVTDAFREAGAKSDTQLRQVGGTGAFRPVIDSAVTAGVAVAAAFQEAANRADAQLRTIGGVDAMAPMIAGQVAAGAALQGVSKQMDADLDTTHGKMTALGGAAENTGSRIGHSFRSFAIPALLGTSVLLTSLVGALAGFGLKGAASLEQTQIGFTSLLGSAEEADAFIKQMQQFAAATPFEFAGLSETARRFLAVGQSIGITRDEILPTITTIGNVVSVLGAPQEALDRVTLAMGQIGSRGKLTAEDLMQIGEALPGFAPFQAIADGLGITTAEAQDMVTKGLIPAEQGIALLLDGMNKFPGAAGAMAAQSQTLNGLLSTLKDTLTLGLTTAFQPLVVSIKDLLPAATEKLGGAITTLAPPISNLITALLPTLTDLVVTLAPFLGELFDIFGQLATELGGPFMDVLRELLPAFSEILRAIVPVLPALAKDFAALAPAAAAVARALADLITAIPPGVLAKLVEAFIAMKVVNSVAGPMVNLGNALKNAGSGGDLLSKAFGKLAPNIQKLMPLIGQGASTGFNALKPILVSVGGAFMGVAHAIGATVVAALPYLAIAAAIAAIAYVIYRNWSTISDFFVELWDTITDAVSSAADTIMSVLMPVIEAIVTALKVIGTVVTVIFLGPIVLAITAVIAAFNLLKPVFAFLWDVLQAAWDGIGRPIFDAIMMIVGQLVAFIQLEFDLIVTIFQVAWATMQMLWDTIAVPLWDAIKAIIGLLVDWFKLEWDLVMTIFEAAWTFVRWVWDNVGSPIFDLITSVISTIVSVFQTVWDTVINIVSTAWDTISSTVSGAIDGVLGFLDGLRSGIADKASGMWDGISSAFTAVLDIIKGAWNRFRDVWNGIEVDVPGVHILGDGDIGGFTFGLPDLPGLSYGDIIDKDMLAFLHAAEVVIPLTNTPRAIDLSNRSGLTSLLANAGALDAARGGDINLEFGAGSIVVSGVSPAEARIVGRAIIDGAQQRLYERHLQVLARTG